MPHWIRQYSPVKCGSVSSLTDFSNAEIMSRTANRPSPALLFSRHYFLAPNNVRIDTTGLASVELLQRWRVKQWWTTDATIRLSNNRNYRFCSVVFGTLAKLSGIGKSYWMIGNSTRAIISSSKFFLLINFCLLNTLESLNLSFEHFRIQWFQFFDHSRIDVFDHFRMNGEVLVHSHKPE